MAIALKFMWLLVMVPSIYGHIFPAFLEDAAKQDPSLIAPLINVGAVGVCLIVLALYFKSKDATYEKRIDAALEREKQFGEKYADLAEKYRTALEKTNATLDTVLNLLRQQLPR